MARRVMAVGAHPDDIEIGCGGSVRRLVLAGWEAVTVCVTSGEAGSIEMSAEELARLRVAEARTAAGVLGVRAVEFLGLPDGLTGFGREDKISMINLIRRYRPEVLFVHAAGDESLDHRVVRELTMAAVFSAAGPWFQGSEGEPWSVPTVLGYEVWSPLPRHGLAVDIGEALEDKLAALRCHASQVGATRYDEAVRGLSRYRGVTGLSCEYAEVFEVVRLGELPGLFSHP